MQRRTIVRFALSAPATLAMGAHAQGEFPTQVITIVVPFAAGGNLDVMTRMVATPMSKLLRQPVVIDNRAGAGGVIGHEFVSRAAPTGYTLVCTANGRFTVTPRMVAKRQFQASDFVAIGGIGETPLVLEVPANSRFRDFASMIAFAKANPEKVSLAHPGNGTTNHIAILRLQQATGAKFAIIPYKGSALALNDLLGSQVEGMVDQLPSSLPHIRAQKLVPLAVTTSVRAADLPNVPTLAELGLEKFEVSTVTGLLAPAKTPAAIISILNQALNTALADTDVQKRLKDMGSMAISGTPTKFQEYLLSEDRAAEALVRNGALTPE